MRNVLHVSTLLLLIAGLAFAQSPLDESALFVASFDDGFLPDVAKGNWEAAVKGDAVCVPDGKFGGALRLPERASVTYPANNGNLNPACGTVSMWIKTDWGGKDGVSRSIFSFRGEGHNYFNLNKIRTPRLGVAMCGGPEKGWVWKRSDIEIPDWQPNTWCHVAATWSSGHLRFYLDGEPVGPPVEEAKAPEGKIPELTLGGSGIVIDDLRIYGVVRSAEAIKAEASAPSQGRLYRHLSSLQPSESKQRFGKVGVGGRVRPDGMPVPLILDGLTHARGIGLRAPASVTFPVEGDYAKLAAIIGIDDLAGDGGSVTFRVLADGQEVFKSRTFENGTPAERIEVPVAECKKLTLIVDDCGDGNLNDLADWADPVLVREGAGFVPSLSKEVAEKTLAMFKRRRDAYRFGFEPPQTDKGYRIAAKSYLDEIDPSAPPPKFGVDDPLSTFATPGEYEPLCFVIYAARELKDVRVEPTDLRCPAGSIPRGAVDVRAVKRSLYRRIYTRPAEQSDVVSRFLVKRAAMDMAARSFQEMHITIHVPDSAEAGVYSGALRVSGANCDPTDVPVSLEVLPFKLRPLERKKYGMYYRMGTSRRVPGRAELELRDMREHGASILYPGIGIRYEMADGKIKPDYSDLRQGLALMRRFGFHGSIPVHDGFTRLARLCGATDLNTKKGKTGASLETNEKFMPAAKGALEGLLKVQQEFAELEFLPTHMDEVFGHHRLPLYIRLTRAVHQVPQFRVYITIHNRPLPAIEKMTRQLLPHVDVRCYNGHSMDEWIKAGHTFEELAKDLKANNDEAWIYYNIRGSFFVAKWMRIINGMYMWVGPFKAHCIWIYHSFKGNPFDDADGPRVKGHDFGLAVPDPADGRTPVPTRHWECYREGIDDMRYICMLEDLIAESKERAPEQTAAAQRWLDSLRDMFPKAEDIADIDLESPLLIAFSRKVNSEAFQKLRRTTAEHIMRLLPAR